MAKASRSKKSQPAFDPHELDDLIFTPAVGRGVGSHLLAEDQEPGCPAPADLPTVDNTNVTSVVETNTPTVDGLHSSTVVDHVEQVAELKEPVLSAPIQATVVTPDLATVGSSVPDPSTVDAINMATVAMPESATVDRSAEARLTLWVTETGDLVPGSRTRRIRLAQDVLNSAEESVYDTLWRCRFAEAPADGADARIVQAGYDFLMKQTRLSKKTIQRIIDRLTDKDFIAIERPADIYRRTPTVYRVFGYRAVLERQARKGRLHAAKIGPGFVFVRRLERLLATGDRSNLSTVAGDDVTPADIAARPTVVPENPTTVVSATTQRIEQIASGRPSSSELRRLRELLEGDLEVIDDGAVESLLEQCRLRAGDCTLEEIAYFVRHKLQWVKAIQNPVGFILTAVPRHFENNGHLPVRKLLRQQLSDKRRAWEETYAYWKRIADDPAEPESERMEARKVLGSLDAPPDQP